MGLPLTFAGRLKTPVASLRDNPEVSVRSRSTTACHRDGGMRSHRNRIEAGRIYDWPPSKAWAPILNAILARADEVIEREDSVFLRRRRPVGAAPRGTAQSCRKRPLL